MNQNLPFSLAKIGKTKTCRDPHQVKWNYQQICLYTIYLQLFLTDNPSDNNRSLTKKQFISMSQIVRSRNPNQCRMFHQKMIKIHSQISELFKMLRENIKQYSSIWSNYQNTREVKESQPCQNLQPIFQEEQACILNKKDDCQEPTGILYQPIELKPPLILEKHYSFSEYSPKFNQRWFQQQDDFLVDSNVSWLEEI